MEFLIKKRSRFGYDADLVLVEGWQLTGWPVVTIVNGQIVYQKSKLYTEIRGKALTFIDQ
nr:hypothetical protein [Stanieria cyanosphaera]